MVREILPNFGGCGFKPYTGWLGLFWGILYGIWKSDAQKKKTLHEILRLTGRSHPSAVRRLLVHIPSGISHLWGAGMTKLNSDAHLRKAGGQYLKQPGLPPGPPER